MNNFCYYIDLIDNFIKKNNHYLTYKLKIQVIFAMLLKLKTY